MEEITFSVPNHGRPALEKLQELMQLFEQKKRIRVRLDAIPRSSLRWPRLVEAALYHSGPDVSEVGNSWVGDLIRMDALRLFSSDEINQIVMGGNYFDTVWKVKTRKGQDFSKVYSIPFAVDVRAIFYRRDLLEKAKIDEEIAFTDFIYFEKTLVELGKCGVPMPLVLPNRWSNMTLQCLASWVWAGGGDFLSPDGKSSVFTQPKAVEGFKTYFRLVRHLSPDALDLEEHEADDVFCIGKAAILLSGFWIPSTDLASIVRENLGVACMPGTSFVGGSDLVIWNHSRHESAAIELINFLLNDQAAKSLYPWFGLPVDEDEWINPPFDSDIYQVLKKAIQNGRGFPHALSWGLVEKRLSDMLADIWTEILKEPLSDLDDIVEAHLVDLANRLELSMGSN
jgi:multiple sugar transport system substrate-binding protein